MNYKSIFTTRICRYVEQIEIYLMIERNDKVSDIMVDAESIWDLVNKYKVLFDEYFKIQSEFSFFIYWGVLCFCYETGEFT